MFQFIRYEGGQILKHDKGIPWEAEGVFNPGIVKIGDEVVMLYRAVGERDAYISHFGLAKSKDGVHFERVGTEPVFGPSTTYDAWATEDPRITQIGQDYYITYVGVAERILDHGMWAVHTPPLSTSTALLRTRDFKNFERLGVISPLNSDNKDVVLFPEKIKGRYAMLHRPNRWTKMWFKGQYAGTVEVHAPCSIEDLPEVPSMWLSWSDDLKTWTDHTLLLEPARSFDAKVGAGIPPIKTKDGWLVIYHSVEKGAGISEYTYTAHVALLDLRNPTKVIARLPYPVLSPEKSYEMSGDLKVVFPTGGFVEGDVLYVYYGVGDQGIALATGSLSGLLAELRKYKKFSIFGILRAKV